MYIQYIHTIYTRNKLKRFLEKLGARICVANARMLCVSSTFSY